MGATVIGIVHAYSAKIVYHNAVTFLNPKPTSPPDFLTYSLLSQFKTGVTKRMNLRHLLTCRTNILWLIYTARRTNSNGLYKNSVIRRNKSIAG